MKGVATSQLPLAAPPPPAAAQAIAVPAADERWRSVRRWLARRAADFWLGILFFHARRHVGYLRKHRGFFLWGGWRFSPFLRENTLCNARRILGEQSTPAQRRALAKAILSNFYDFICDVGASTGMSRQQLLERVAAIEGHDIYRAARDRRRGAIVVTAHMGSFEIGTAALLEHERRVHVLFRRDANGLFERTRSALRRRLGVVEACVDDGLSVWLRLREALAADEVVLIQGDRVVPGQKGRRVPFLGGHMLLPTGPVKLALVSGAPIVPIFSVRQPDGRIRLVVEPPIDVPDASATEGATLKLAAVIERYVRRYPAQWLMIHKCWCEDAQGVQAAPATD